MLLLVPLYPIGIVALLLLPNYGEPSSDAISLSVDPSKTVKVALMLLLVPLSLPYVRAYFRPSRNSSSYFISSMQERELSWKVLLSRALFFPDFPISKWK